MSGIKKCDILVMFHFKHNLTMKVIDS